MYVAEIRLIFGVSGIIKDTTWKSRHQWCCTSFFIIDFERIIHSANTYSKSPIKTLEPVFKI